MRATHNMFGTIAVALFLGLGALAVPQGLLAQEEKQEEPRYEEARYEESAPYADLMTALSENPEFSAFSEMVKAADLGDELRGEGPFTLFVPTNSALAKVTETGLKGQARHNEKLRRIVENHLVTGEALTAEQLAGKDHVETMQTRVADEVTTQAHEVKVEDGQLMLDGQIRVLRKDIRAGNGIIHVISGPLMARAKGPQKTPLEDTP